MGARGIWALPPDRRYRQQPAGDQVLSEGGASEKVGLATRADNAGARVGSNSRLSWRSAAAVARLAPLGGAPTRRCATASEADKLSPEGHI